MRPEIMSPAMRRCAARLILPPVLSAFAAAGCGSHPPRPESGLADASAAGAAAGPSRLLSVPLSDSDPLPTDDPLLTDGSLPTDDPLPAAGDEARSVDPPAGDEAPSLGGCDPNYDPCVPVDSDVDCEGGRGNGPSYVAGPVRVVGRDRYDLDRDGDGLGCDH